MSEPEVILVNEQDEAIGTMPKMEAHEKGALHRAFSVFIFDSRGRMLLQQRAAGKYHGAHLWTNACCSHPYPGEVTAAAAQRRLLEELGFAVPLQSIFSFTYRADVENGLIEHEFDHVFAGTWEKEINFNKDEVAAVRYQSMSDIKADIEKTPHLFTTWFRLAFPTIEKWWQQQYRATNV
ncbi:MAG: isopentenyl-diphosphate Delta-isomerase [Chitinophagaceae bacterium]